MRSDHLQLALEISLLALFFVAVLIAVPAVVAAFILVGDLTISAEKPQAALDDLGLGVYLVAFAVFAVPIVTLVGIGWAVRRYVAGRPH